MGMYKLKLYVEKRGEQRIFTLGANFTPRRKRLHSGVNSPAVVSPVALM
jgi:hypothetical protein